MEGGGGVEPSVLQRDKKAQCLGLSVFMKTEKKLKFYSRTEFYSRKL